MNTRTIPSSFSRSNHSDRSGVILLVVLSSLTFFSLLVVTYFVFSSQARRSAYAMNVRSTRAPDINGLIDDALMTILVGTADSTNPMARESLLDDYYGTDDAFDMRSRHVNNFSIGPFHLGKGFVRIPIGIENDPGGGNVNRVRAYQPLMDDLYNGRLITFREGPLRNKTYRVIRSVFRETPPPTPPATQLPYYDDVYIQVPLEDWDPNSGIAIQSLFYADPADLTQNGFRFRLNGVPQNSPGLGYSGGNLSQNVLAQGGGGFNDLPVSLQPNQLLAFGTLPDKDLILGDADEGYDAPDMLNWWLSYRHPDGTVIPSFHRPSVLNYIINQESWGSADYSQFRDLAVSLSRGTMRPLSIQTSDFELNPNFTGGSENFGLRTQLKILSDGAATPQVINPPRARAHLHQLLVGLINQPDVDNDGDGRKDSIWINPGLPLITSPEGKLLRPLIAPMIEDLSARLNVNAVGNTQLLEDHSGLQDNPHAMWAGARGALSNTVNNRDSFRGLGHGPAEMAIPAVSLSSGRITNPSVLNDLNRLVLERYGADNVPGNDVYGSFPSDGLDNVRRGFHPFVHNGLTGYGHSFDPFGRGGIGIGLSGDLVSANSGGEISNANPIVNESDNDPYEFDPSGELDGDDAYTVAELEAIIRSNGFENSMRPARLQDRLANLIENAPEFRRSVTTTSVSIDSPPSLSADTPLLGFLESISPGSANTLDQASLRTLIQEIVPPEFRNGHKLDVNRPFGDGVDNDGDLLIDEPDEQERTTDNIDNDNDGTTDEDDERVEYAFATQPNRQLPNGFGSSTLTIPDLVYDSTTATSGRQLLARNLYVLMMALSNNNFQFPSAGPNPFDTTGTPSEADLYRARRLAQWAVNVVDYRDADSIMTRFAFDPNPFDGWTPGASAEHIVWGVESPDLVFTESAAFHDVRCRDTEDDNGDGDDKANGDADSDQVRIPEGSLLLELLCTHPVITTGGSGNDEVAQPSFPQELYDNLGNLDLDRVAPPLPGNTIGVPVWRIAISEPHQAGSPKANLNPMTLRNSEPDVAAFTPETLQEREIDPPLGVGAALNMERFIWFGTFANQSNVADVITENSIPDMNANGSEVFFVPTGVPGNPALAARSLAPGQYLTLAPRRTTFLGSREAPVSSFPGAPSKQRFEVDFGQGLIHYEFGLQTSANNLVQNGLRTTPNLGAGENYTPALPMVVGTFPPLGWAGNNFQDNYVGLNVSEPMPRAGAYYPEPLTSYNDPAADNDNDGNADYARLDAYLNFSDPTTHLARDTPLDPGFGIIPSAGSEPQLGSIPEFRTAFLQRLADPTKPYDSITNPYRTIDWTPIDLTVFSGEDRESNINAAPASYHSYSRQRNGSFRQYDASGTPSSVGSNVLFSRETGAQTLVSIDSTQPEYFRLAAGTNFMRHSFSFLNTRTDGAINYGQPDDADDERRGRCNRNFVGFSASIGDLQAAATNISTTDRNQPQVAFAKHPWLNRPFASPFELMMVPACSQARLFEEFTINTVVDPTVFPDSSTTDDSEVFQGPFRHLLNFFHSSSRAASGTSDDNGADFARLFDFVHTLPRFRGEVDMITPAQLTSTDAAQEAQLVQMRALIAPPFNYHYDNRRLGRVNLNTLSEFPVWAGMMHGHLNDDTEFINPAAPAQLSFQSFLSARRGYDVPNLSTDNVISGSAGNYNYDPDKFNPNYPTQFAGVFKRTGYSQFAPRIRSDSLRRRDNHGGLFRSNGTLATNEGSNANTQLFVRNSTQAPIPANVAEAHRDRDRNPFMRYQTLMRMPNLVTDNSQTYVVWLTLGFFEVDPDDTTRLGREYNSDIGQNQRYRAMFIVDRSLPVGFLPGNALNARDTVIFESYDQ